MNLNDAYSLINTMKYDYLSQFSRSSPSKASIDKLDQEYAKEIKDLTQDQRKIMLAILNPQKYGSLDLNGSAEQTVKGRVKRGKSTLKKISRASQNFFDSRISSEVVQKELHKWAKNKINPKITKQLSADDF